MGGMCGGEEENSENQVNLENKDDKKNPEGEETKKDSPKKGEEGKDEEKKEEKPKAPEPPKIDNEPYKKMKALANPKAWKNFETYTLHEAPKGAPKSSGTTETKDVQTEKNGDMYKGSVDDKLKYQGFGVNTRKKTGNVYQGMHNKGKEEGAGILFHGKGKQEGEIFEGQFKGGKPNNGKAKVTYPNGDLYEGDSAKGLAQGKGKLTKKGGAIVIGEFKGGFPQGKATETEKNGDKYEGQWAKGERNGKGKLTKGGKVTYAAWKAGAPGKEIK